MLIRGVVQSFVVLYYLFRRPVPMKALFATPLERAAEAIDSFFQQEMEFFALQNTLNKREPFIFEQLGAQEE